MLRSFLTVRNRCFCQSSFSVAKRRWLSDRSSTSEPSEPELIIQDPGLRLDDVDELMSDTPLEEAYPKTQVRRDLIRRPISGHNVLVIQPWSPTLNLLPTNVDLQLEEAVSLANTIHSWNVVGKKLLFARDVGRATLVNPKAFDELKNTVRGHPNASAVFFGVDVLSGVQLVTLEEELQMPVYDRFTVVMNIFRQHARTKEAKLQLALAELPYIKHHLREIHESTEVSSMEHLKVLVGGASDALYHERLAMLKRRESMLKRLLADFNVHRNLNKKNRKRNNIPTVSIVGYTNSGKTSLIKNLTGDQDMEPKDQLFATLDVTVHGGRLPSFKDVLYVDTVGFISRVPDLLVEAFSMTLRDIAESHLIVHVLDVTHPDHRLQYRTVVDSLTSIGVGKEMIKRRVVVGNKADRLQGGELPPTMPRLDALISATDGTNVDKLVVKVDRELKLATLGTEHEFRVRNGGEEYDWLVKNATITSCVPDQEDGNYLICLASASPALLGRFRKRFGLGSERRTQ